MTFRPGIHLLVVLAMTFAGCAKQPVATTPPPDPLQLLAHDITAATALPGVRRAAWGIVVQSLDRDERLFALNPGTLLVPASVAKLVSLAGAVDAVGWNFRFETEVRAAGPIVDGTLDGDLIVVGSGDPSIGGRAGQALSVWVDALKAIGLKRIEGRIVGDDNAGEEPRPQLAWAWDDLGYTTGALWGALNLRENRMTVAITPAVSLNDRPTISVGPAESFRLLRNRTTTGTTDSSLLIWPEQRPGEPFLTIAGSVPAGAPPAELLVSAGNPTLWFASGLRHALVEGGIDITGDAFDIDDLTANPEWATSTVLYTHQSPTLAEIAQPLLRDSINLYGEAVLKLNADRDGLPTNDAALEGLRTRLTTWGIPTDAWQLIDGSGLSRRNAIAPETLVAVLRRMYDPAWTSPWISGLPVAGRDGTLANRMRGTPAEDNLRAKTGTMSNIRSLAGYVRTLDGEVLAFVLLADGFEGSGREATEAIDRIAARLAGFSRVAE
ncbi:MAG: D-alanyl-D-alanine carboxypeptidase/D-alanyl-D-alanine-endopeptidase [Acidobacteria bacterium]|nr:D-alanyl-D-alanine carboxypeptidase/D-alanyl-D-alanine-endopeptidase [Acidobacteriota bacterium]